MCGSDSGTIAVGESVSLFPPASGTAAARVKIPMCRLDTFSFTAHSSYDAL